MNLSPILTLDLVATGDQMQSEASRVLEWAKGWSEDVPCSYETRMAMIALKCAIDDWTELRASA